MNLNLLEKLATSSITSHRATPISNKKGRCNVCKGLSSLRRCDQVTWPKAHLDCAAICPITQSPNKHLETDKRKIIARLYLCHEHPAGSWWRCFMLPSRHIICSPINHYVIASLMQVFTSPLSPNVHQASSIWTLRDAYLELTLLNLDDDQHLMSSSHELYIILLLMHAHGTITNPHRQNIDTYAMC
jgi:hypothetical protein